MKNCHADQHTDRLMQKINPDALPSDGGQKRKGAPGRGLPDAVSPENYAEKIAGQIQEEPGQPRKVITGGKARERKSGGRKKPAFI